MEVKKEVFTNKGNGTVEFNRKEADYVRNRLLHLAKKKIESNKCRCGEKKRKAVPLFEFGDPYIPSQVVLFCPKCKKNEVFAARPPKEAMQYAELVMGKQYDGKPISQQEKANMLIEQALEQAKNPIKEKMEEEDAIKDENDEVIAGKDKMK